MNYSVFRLTLNMHNHRSQASVAAFQGDTAVRLLFTLTDGGNTYFIADGCTAWLSATKPDGSKLLHRCTIVNNTTIQYDFIGQTTSISGIVNCEIVLYGADGKELTTPKFTIVVDEREVNDSDLPEESESILSGIALAEDARVNAEEARAGAETSRGAAEGARVVAEAQRVVAEVARAESETARVSAEGARAEAEASRASAEEVRAEAETQRVDAESSRASAEEARQLAEDERSKYIGVTSIEQTTTSTEDSGTNFVTITKSDGTETVFVVRNGSKGSTGEKGEKGDPFTVAKVFSSVAEMNGGYDTDGVAVGSFVVIESSVNDEDNAKLYLKGNTSYMYITDLSGAQGLQGPQGEKGDTYVLTDTDKSEIAGLATAKIKEAKAEMLAEIEAVANIVQTTGTSETKVMSQKAVTDEIGDCTVIDLAQYNLTQGTISDGVVMSNTKRCVTQELISIDDKAKIHLNVTSGSKIALHFYDNQSVFIVWSEWKTADSAIVIPDGAACFRVVIATTNDDVITPDVAITKGEISFYYSKIEDYGDRIAELESAGVYEKEAIDLSQYNLTNGTISYGEFHDNTKRCRINSFIDTSCAKTLYASIKKDKYQYSVHWYDANKVWFGATDWITDEVISIPSNAKYILLTVSTTNAAVITSEEAITAIEFELLTSNIERVKNENAFALSTGKIQAFSTLFNGTDKVETFMYFTDPHLCMFNGNNWREEFDKYMITLRNYYGECAVERVFCGGDWLGRNETVAEACYRLGLIDSTMRENFKEYHNIVGNHDTNYQGVAELSNNTIRNLFFRKEGKAFYSVDGINTKFLIFDTHKEHEVATDYDNEQILWYLSELQKNTTENIILMPHIVYPWADDNGIYTPTVHPLASKLLEIAQAFNNKTTISVLGTSYNFASATGKVRCLIGGHSHTDYVTTINTVPVVLTTHLRDGNSPTFDLCLADYDNNILKLVRIGAGADREIAI